MQYQEWKKMDLARKHYREVPIMVLYRSHFSYVLWARSLMQPTSLFQSGSVAKVASVDFEHNVKTCMKDVIQQIISCQKIYDNN